MANLRWPFCSNLTISPMRFAGARRHGDNDLFQIQRVILLQNHFRRADHRHPVNPRTPLLCIIIKKSHREQAQTSLGEKVVHEAGADVPGAHNPNPLGQGVVTAVGRQVSFPQKAKSQPGAGQAQEGDQEIAQDDPAGRSVSAPGGQPDGHHHRE